MSNQIRMIQTSEGAAAADYLRMDQSVRMGRTMSPLLLATFNHYTGTKRTASEAAAYVARLPVFPVPERMAMDDWRAHVPMHLLEAWATLPTDERIALYVMAQSATHPFDCHFGPEEPAMN